MASFNTLLEKLPKSNESRMSAQGYVLWFCWQHELDPVINQTLQNYGGMHIISDHEQSIWFFFNKDVFLALARLSVWARFNSLSASVELISGRLYFGVKGENTISLDSSFEQQDMYPGKTLVIYVHPKVLDKDANFPGITFSSIGLKQGMTVADWSTLEADTRLPYTSSQGWYALMRPLGNPLDAAYQDAWPYMQQYLVDVLKQNKLKFLVNNDFIMVSIDNLLILRTWLKDTLGMAEETKIHKPEHVWPYLTVVVDRKGLNFNNDLYKKIGLQWDKLSPDLPYMSYRTAYLLGESFVVHDIRFSNSQNDMDAWCTVALDEVVSNTPAISLLMPAQLISGDENCCFFCGINTHKSMDCPTLAFDSKVVEEVQDTAELDLDLINQSFRSIEKNLSARGLEAYPQLLEEESDEDVSAPLLRAIFDINYFSQVRSAPYMWLTKGRDLGKARDFEELVRDDHFVWELFDKLCKAGPAEVVGLIKDMQEIISRNPRDMRLRSLLGFMYVYMDDLSKAHASFKEAATLTALPAMQAWSEYLQARTFEIQEQYMDAIAQYNQILRVMPQWKDLIYRRIVCKVKMGFVEQELGNVTKLGTDDPAYLNKYLIHPELGRGQLTILTHLYPLWKDTELHADAEVKKLDATSETVKAWFPPEHPSHGLLNGKVEELQRIAAIKNYMAFLHVIKMRPFVDKEIEEFIQRQIEVIQERYKFYLNDLQNIRDEAAWFPFPKLLRDFSREFNEAASILNWAFSANFHEAENFKRAQDTKTEVEGLLQGLKRRLKILRAMRDGTLFTMTFGKTFLWIEGIGLLLCLLGIPAIVLFGDSIGLSWLKALLASQQWEIQKVLVGIVTVMSFGLAMLRSTITFERQRDNYLEKAKEQRERMQEERLERIRKKNEAESARLAAERKAEEEKMLRQRYEAENR